MLGVVFPGQGSQHPGMGKFLWEEFSLVKSTFEEASDALSVDVKKLCFDSDERDLSLTHNTQPALLVCSVAGYRVLRETVGIAPSCGAGHSVGEYAAAVASGALGFTEAVQLVRQRGTFMQEAVPVGQGGMLAVMGLTEDEVYGLCQWAQKTSGLSPLEPANFNSPQQIVVSGSAKLCTWTLENFTPDKIKAQAKKIRLIPLKVSAPFHCSLMQSAQDAMELALNQAQFTTAKWPIAQNIDGHFYTAGAKIRENLVKQVTGAVKWTHCISSLREKGVTSLIECGPGKVLTGLLKKSEGENISTFNLNSLDDLRNLEKELH